MKFSILYRRKWCRATRERVKRRLRPPLPAPRHQTEHGIRSLPGKSMAAEKEPQRSREAGADDPRPDIDRTDVTGLLAELPRFPVRARSGQATPPAAAICTMPRRGWRHGRGSRRKSGGSDPACERPCEFRAHPAICRHGAPRVVTAALPIRFPPDPPIRLPGSLSPSIMPATTGVTGARQTEIEVWTPEVAGLRVWK